MIDFQQKECGKCISTFFLIKVGGIFFCILDLWISICYNEKKSVKIKKNFKRK
jgi:hypothetical protein